MRIDFDHNTGKFFLTDVLGDVYELQPTGRPGDPVRIVPISRGHATIVQ